MTEYGWAVATLGDRYRRKVGNNDTLHAARGDAVALQYHATDVITWHPDGTVDLVPWDSVTTRRRFDKYLSGVRVGTESGFQRLTYAGNAYGLHHAGRVTLHPDGTVTGDVIDAAAHADRVREHRRAMARDARARRKLAAAQAEASATLAAVRTVFRDACGGYVTAYAAALAAVSTVARSAGWGDGYGRGVRVPIRSTRHLAEMQREREAAAGRMLAATVAAFGAPFAAWSARRESARGMLAVARDAFGAAFAWSVRQRDALAWCAANGVTVDGSGCAWLAKRVVRDGSGGLVSHWPGTGGRTVWYAGATVEPDRFEPGAWCGAGLHACATDTDARQWVDGPESVPVAVRVRAVDIVTDHAHGIGGARGGKVKVPRVVDVAVSGPARRAVLGGRVA